MPPLPETGVCTWAEAAITSERLIFRWFVVACSLWTGQSLRITIEVYGV